MISVQEKRTRRSRRPLESLIKPLANGCHEWTGSIDRDGYGRRNERSARDGVMRPRLAHRVVYEQRRGEIPAGLVLDHDCHNADARCSGGASCQHRRCVNPEHLSPCTPKSNNSRQVAQNHREVAATAFSERLRANPGEWFVYDGKQDNSLGWRIRSGRHAAFSPASDFEAIDRRTPEGRRTSVRFVGSQA